MPVYRKSFEKDVKRAKKRGKSMDKLKSTLIALIEQRELPVKCRDHALVGNYAHHRECHIEPDWLLILMCQRVFPTNCVNFHS